MRGRAGAVVAVPGQTSALRGQLEDERMDEALFEAALAFRAPEGFAQFATYWWHAPETICLIAAVIAAIRPRRWFRLTGAMTCVSAFMVFWKIIHMGQAFGRNASTFSDAAAFLDIVSPGSLLVLAGGAGLWLALALLLSMLFPWNAAKEAARVD